jgi:hypothetical protein
MKITLLVALAAFVCVALGLRRFDVAYYICPTVTQADGTRNISYACPPVGNSRGTCMCEWDFQQLNSKGGHDMVIQFPTWHQNIFANGNSWSFIYDQISDDFPGSGAGFADKVYEMAKKYAEHFQLSIPKYFFLNEISHSRWRENREGYHQYVIDMAKRLRNDYKVIPVVFSPLMKPDAKFKSKWVELAKYAYIGVEAYINTKQVFAVKGKAARGKYMKKQYDTILSFYQKCGVKKNRIAFFEHYGNSDGKRGAYGRVNVPAKDWIQIIQLRNQIFKSVGTWAVGSYGWMSNQMKVPTNKSSEDDRSLFYGAYNSAW